MYKNCRHQCVYLFAGDPVDKGVITYHRDQFHHLMDDIARSSNVIHQVM